MADMNIRNVSEDQLKEWKLKAMAQGVSLREWVIERLGGAGANAPSPGVDIPSSTTPRNKPTASRPGRQPAASGSPRCVHGLAYHPGCNLPPSRPSSPAGRRRRQSA